VWGCGVEAGEERVFVAVVHAEAVDDDDGGDEGIDPQTIFAGVAQFHGVEGAGNVAPLQGADEALVAIEQHLAADFERERGNLGIAYFDIELTQIERIVALRAEQAGDVGAVTGDLTRVLALDIKREPVGRL
jgi:hypothetical protein